MELAAMCEGLRVRSGGRGGGGGEAGGDDEDDGNHVDDDERGTAAKIETSNTQEKNTEYIKMRLSLTKLPELPQKTNTQTWLLTKNNIVTNKPQHHKTSPWRNNFSK